MRVWRREERKCQREGAAVILGNTRSTNNPTQQRDGKKDKGQEGSRVLDPGGVLSLKFWFLLKENG